MPLFDRMRTTWFPPKGEPSRKPRVAFKPPPDNKDTGATIDERTAFAAAEILENHSFERVIKRLRNEAYEEFSSSAEGEAGAYSRDKAHAKIAIIEDIEASIQSMADQIKFFKRSDTEPLT